MRIAYDYFQNVEAVELFLCNPTYETVGAILAKDREVTLRFNDLSELSFTAIRNTELQDEDGHPLHDRSYELIQKNRLVYATNIGWFVIDTVSENVEGDYMTKSVSCKSLQCAIGNRGVVCEERVYKFYNPDDPTDKYYDEEDEGQVPSVVGQMVQQLGIVLDIKDSYYTPGSPYDDWTLCYVPASLRYSTTNTTVRSMTKETMSGYDFLSNQVSEAFRVVFDFDILNKCINVLTEEDIATVSDVVLSFHNFMKNMKVDEDSDGLVTVMAVNGSDIDIRGVNPLGTNYILDFSYFMEGVARSTDWCVEINQDVFREKMKSLGRGIGVYTFTWNNSKNTYCISLSGTTYRMEDFGIYLNSDPLQWQSDYAIRYLPTWMSEDLADKLAEWQEKVDDEIDDFAALTLKMRNAYLAKLEAKNGVEVLSKSLQDLRRASDNRTEALTRENTKLHGIITAELVEKTKNSMYPNSKFYPGNPSYSSPFSGNEEITLHQNPPNVYNTTTGKFSWTNDNPQTVHAYEAFDWGYVAEGYRYFQDDTGNQEDDKNQKTYCRLEGGVKLNVNLDWSTTGALTVDINRQTWKDYVKNNAGTYTFTYTSGVWKYGTTMTINLSDYGVSYKGTPVSGDKIVVVYSYEGNPECYCSGFTRFADYDEVDAWIEILSWNVSAGNAEEERQQSIVDDCIAQQTAISDELNIFAYFADSPDLLKELSYYWIEGSYDDEHIASLDSTSPEEEIKLALELYDNAKQALSKACRPKYSFSCDLIEAMTSHEFASQVQKIELGRIIQVEREDTIWYYPALLEISYNLDSAGDFKFTFSDRLKLEDFGLTFADMIGKSASVSQQVVASWQDLIDYSQNKVEIQSKLDNPLDATLRAGIANAINQEIVIDNTGLLGRKFKTFPSGVNYKGSVGYHYELYSILDAQAGDVYTVVYAGSAGSIPDGSMYVCVDANAPPFTWTKFDEYTTNSYEPEQVRLMNNLLIFTDDGWQTAKLALGKITLPGTSTQAYGLIAEYLIGQVLLGNNLIISNGLSDSENKVEITANGIKVLHLGGTVISLDATTGNAVFRGTIYANAGEFSGQLKAASGSFAGELTAATGNFSGALSAAGGSVGGTLSANKISASTVESTSAKVKTIQIDGITVQRKKVGGSSITETADFFVSKSQVGDDVTLVTINSVESASMEELPMSSDVSITVTYTSTTPSVSVSKTVVMRSGTSSVSTTFPYYSSGSIIGVSPSSTTVTTGTSGMSMLAVAHRLCPSTDDTYNLGDNGYKWHEVYATLGTINTSDRNKKKDIAYDTDKHDALFRSLKPCTYKFKENDDREHFGFIAQDIEESMEGMGMNPSDYGLVMHKKTETGDFHGMAYAELHALEVAQIQKLLAIVEEQGRQIKELTEQLNNLK